MNDEEKKQIEEEAEAKLKAEKEAANNKPAGDKYETTPIIERAREERERMEKATAAQKIENDRAEKIAARNELGGGSEAGTAKEAKPEETNKEYNSRIEKEIESGQHNE